MSGTKKLTNELLKEKMTDAVAARYWCQDVDLCKTAGAYACGAECLNLPDGRTMGTLVVFESGDSNYGILQIFVPHNASTFFVRLYWRGWLQWRKLTGLLI